jgi:NADPH:quinone reductase-like Zn-dependent oxidoreductase
MRAVVHDAYGAPDVLRIEDVECPVPLPNELLVRVRAATVSRTDTGLRSGRPAIMRLGTGLRGPRRRILGSDFAGDVVELGAGVTAFAVGDRVFGERMGAHAELLRVRERGLVAHLPEALSYEDGAAICDGALKALICLRRAGSLAGKRVAVYGASGAIGTAALQVAKHFDANVTAICNTKNLELVRSLGADDVIDYTREDFTRSGECYDVILDAVGRHSFRRCRRVLAAHGAWVTTDGGFLWQNLPLALLSRRVQLPIGMPTQQDVLFVKRLIEAGQFRPVVDRTYPLEEVVEATRYVETEQKVGNVVLRVRAGAGVRYDQPSAAVAP